MNRIRGAALQFPNGTRAVHNKVDYQIIFSVFPLGNECAPLAHHHILEEYQRWIEFLPTTIGVLVVTSGGAASSGGQHMEIFTL